MDVKLTEEQIAIEGAVRAILGRHTSDVVSRMPRPANQELMLALHQGGYLNLVQEASSIEATLVTELAAASDAPVAGRALVGPLVAQTEYPSIWLSATPLPEASSDTALISMPY